MNETGNAQPDGTQQGCRCTGAESADCEAYCPFAGGGSEEGELLSEEA